MDVRLPDGTIIKGVPDGMSKADLTAKLQANGYDIGKLTAPAAPELPESLRPRSASPEGMPGARQELSTGQRVYQAARPYVAPLLEAGGAIAGGLVGTPLGPTGAVGGAGLGYGIAKEGLEMADVAMGMKQPRTGAAQVTEPLRNVAEGAAFEIGGQVLGQGIGKVAGKIADIRKIPQNKALDIVRQASGPDLPEVINALRAGQGQGISAAQALANVNNPTLQALIARVTARDPRFTRAMDTVQDAEAINALAKFTGGVTAAETRATTNAMKDALNTVQGPVRETALNRANLGKAVADYEAQAGKLSADAAAKVQEVRRLIELGDVAAAAARLETIKMGMPASSRLAPAKSQAGFSDEFAAKFTYPGKLAQMSDEWASKAADASLDLGQGARFAQGAANAMRSVGIKPLKGDQIIGSIRSIANNPEFAGNDLLLGAVKNVADDITKWSGSGGVIDAKALDAIRKNSVNAAIQQLRPGVDATTQRNLAAEVMGKLKPTIIDAIESAGGTGYRQYLGDYTKGMQKIAEKQLSGEALRLWKTDKDAFVRLVQNESPDVVEKFLGPGKYNIATELAEDTLSVLRDQAQKRLAEMSIKGQVSAGQDALKQLLLDNTSKLRLPSYLSAVAATTNKALNILENKIGAKTMATLTEGLKTPEGAVSFLERLPAEERSRVLKLISDPTQWSQGAKAIVRGTTAAGVNALAPDRYTDNALAP
ncbi:MAG: hypothetical protein AN484_12000 [Aphanizomenon flos-aquae WA102]|uniref:Uncharacterized protein n=1 Tax=Aphanizomenon flos-aquae WA102 TaxID=1710896 RepID=A0A1B7X2D0_APHFL|nr:MAG: hypothetical protein AN484_12000 [Aphanizomenon flos-aquae WA102]